MTLDRLIEDAIPNLCDADLKKAFRDVRGAMKIAEIVWDSLEDLPPDDVEGVNVWSVLTATRRSMDLVSVEIARRFASEV